MQNPRKLLFAYIPLRDFLYILQLEEYDLLRFASQVKQRLFKRQFEKRGRLLWTFRARLIALLYACCLALLTIGALSLHLYLLFALLLLVPLCTPFFIGFISAAIEPLVQIAKWHTMYKAKHAFADRYPNAKIIAITGSYGKTTTKYVLFDLLKYTYAVSIIPNNINTTLGIANHILHGELPEKLEYLIVEMGAYERGDIAQICSMLKPDISIITKLGDQHLERFGSFKNLVHAKYEIFAHAKETTAKFTTLEACKIIQEQGLSIEGVTCATEQTDQRANEELAAAVARHLRISDAFIADALAKFTPVERRNASYQLHGIQVIDNSYNLSPQTALQILQNAEQTAKKQNKAVVVMTAGISEQGNKAQEVNQMLAKLLNQYASRAIIHPSIYARFITENLSIPFQTETFARDVLADLPRYVDANTEILLHLPEQTDLSYL